jgi:hypothetical protein
MESFTWRPCWNDPSIWRMFYVRPDRELLVTVDLPHAKLLAFELEWDDAQGRRRYLTWSAKKGFEMGGVDPEHVAGPEGLADVRIPSTSPPAGEVLGAARRIVEGAGLGSPLGDWILARLAA